ncbi:hypothetical protein C3492_37350 [Streptomyces sp. Ru62]|nr:hypothetical protein C3492_37350 [Streptomyces sp. Ru62]
MIRLGTALAGIGGALGGGFLGATAHYVVRTLGQRHRDEQSGLQAQRQAVHRQFRHVCAARDWVAGLPQAVSASDSPEHRHQVKAEAVRRSDECHAVWDVTQVDIDSGEVRSAMAGLDREVATVLGKVAKGDFAPDMNRLQRRLDELTAAAKHRLTTRLGARPHELTRLRRGGAAGRHQEPPRSGRVS